MACTMATGVVAAIVCCASESPVDGLTVAGMAVSVASTVGERSRVGRCSDRSDVPLATRPWQLFTLRDFIYAQLIHRKFYVHSVFLRGFMEVNDLVQRLTEGGERATGAQRLYGRFMGTALVAGPLLVAGVVWASPAQADATTFVNDLHKAGMHAVNGGDPALLQMGWNVCQQLSWGAPPGQLEDLALQRADSSQGNRGITPQQADDIVIYAVRDLCP